MVLDKSLKMGVLNGLPVDCLPVKHCTWKAGVSKVEVGFHGRSVRGTFGLIIAVAMKCTGS